MEVRDYILKLSSLPMHTEEEERKARGFLFAPVRY